MFFIVFSINNFERSSEFAEVFLFHFVNKPKQVFAIAHKFMIWITSLSRVQRKGDLFLSAVTINNGIWNYFYKLVFTSLFPIPSCFRTKV